MVDKRMSQSFKIILVTVKSDLSRDQERHGVMSVCVCGGILSSAQAGSTSILSVPHLTLVPEAGLLSPATCPS